MCGFTLKSVGFCVFRGKRMKAVCGLDVHKDSVYLCILSEFGELIEKVFGVLTYQLEEVTTQHPHNIR